MNPQDSEVLDQDVDGALEEEPFEGDLATPRGPSRPIERAARPVLVLDSKSSSRQFLADLYYFRELFVQLAMRDFLVRYKQAFFGVAWAVIRPMLTMVIFTIIFGRIAKLTPTPGVPYSIMVLTAMLPWQFFASMLMDGSMSLIANQRMVQKVFFPRIMLPASKMLVCLADFAIASVILAAMMVWYQFVPSWRIVFVPLFILLTMVAALGVALWTSALTVFFRDFKYVVPFAIQLGLYISPVGFQSALIPEKYRFWYSLNPMVGIIDGMRWAVLGTSGAPYLPGIIAATVLSLVLMGSGLWYFRRMEKSFADLI